MTTHRFCSAVLVLFILILPVTIPYPLPAKKVTFAPKPGVGVVNRLRNPLKPRLDDPSLTSKIVSSAKSLAQPTEASSNTIHSPPTGPARFHGAAWYGFAALALLLILMTGLLAGLTLAVMSVDMTRLRVWTRTGSSKRRAQAIAVLGLRQHPNWLLTSFILSSIAVGQALPMITNHLFTPGAMLPFVISTILLTLIGSLLPQAIMPLYTLMIASRMAWFITMLMWLTAPLSVPLGFVFRWCKILGKWKEEWKSDGILSRDELAEFVRLHQIDAGLGGKLGNKVGECVRCLIVGERSTMGEITGWDGLFKTCQDQQVDAALLAGLAPIISPFMIVATDVHGGGKILGVVLRETIQAVTAVKTPVYIRDLPIHSVPIVRQDCNMVTLTEWLLTDDERVAIVVDSNNIINCGANGLSWSPGGPYGDPPLGPVTSTPISPLGIITPRCVLRRLLLGINDNRKTNQHSPIIGTESTGYHASPGRSFSMPTHRSTPSTEDFPAHSLRNRANTLKGVSDENAKNFKTTTSSRVTPERTSHSSVGGRFDGSDGIECVLSRQDSLFSRLVSQLPSSPSDSIRPVELSPLANVMNPNTKPHDETETLSSCCSSVNDETGLRFRLGQQVSEIENRNCENREFAFTELSQHSSSRRQSRPSRQPNTLDSSAAYWRSDGRASFPRRTSEHIRGVRISSSHHTSACGEIHCTRPSPVATEKETPHFGRVEQQYKSLPDPADDCKAIQLHQAMQGEDNRKEGSPRKAEKRHESLTDPQDDADVNDIINRVVWKRGLREELLQQPATSGEEEAAVGKP